MGTLTIIITVLFMTFYDRLSTKNNKIYFIRKKELRMVSHQQMFFTPPTERNRENRDMI